MLRGMTTSSRAVSVLAFVLAFTLSGVMLCPGRPLLPSVAMAQGPSYEQEILGPGLYAYQTRVLEATCGDASQTGFVSTYMGSIDGIPGSRSMVMKLMNNRYWPEWTITIRRDGTVIGSAEVSGENRRADFEVRRRSGRFVGTGSRTYQSVVDGQRRTCTVRVDVLLRRFDV